MKTLTGTFVLLPLLVLSVSAADDPIRQGPRVLQPAAEGIGRLIPDVTFRALDGRSHKLSEFRNKDAVVVVFTSTSCPVSKRYLPSLDRLESTYRERSVEFIYVNPTSTDSAESVRAAVRDNHLRGLYTQAANHPLQVALQPRTTTESFVLDRARTLVYRGSIDDQYGLAYSLDQPKQRFVAAALDAVLAHQVAVIRSTSAPGCALEAPKEAALKPVGVTWHNRVSRIMETHCVECHREGGVAPFALTSLREVASHAGMINQVVERGTMPPWFSAPVKGQQHSPWINDRTMPEADKRDLISWLKGGRPVGDPGDAPVMREFPSGWLIGKPDAVFEFREPVAVKAAGAMPYQNIMVDTGLTEDKWVRSLEVRPGNRAVVHHVLVFAQRGDSEKGEQDAAGEARSGFYAIYVPGNSTLIYPEGYAKRLPKGARLRFQVHYTPNGTATTDQTKLGVIYADAPPLHEVRVVGVSNVGFSIPPNASNYSDSAEIKLPADVQVLGFLPHMHLRGKAARYELTADGEQSTLLDVPRYDFNWQLLYRYANPPVLKAGSTLKFTAWYDNSAGNPANPDPAKTVRWGPQTYEEMLLGYVEYVVPSAKPGEVVTLAPSGGGIAARIGAISFHAADANGDGEVSLAEFKAMIDRIPVLAGRTGLAERMFERLDTDHNGALSAEEFDKLRETGPGAIAGR